MILELAHNISVIWPNQIQRKAHARVYTNKTCSVINQWNWGWAERHVSPRPIVQIALWSTWSVLERAAHTRAHAHTHFSLRNSVSRVDCTFNVLLSNMSSNLVTVKTAFYNNRQTIDLILTFRFGPGGTNV